jgi:DNA-directed RNA polymerase specialized sigma24 family protein
LLVWDALVTAFDEGSRLPGDAAHTAVLKAARDAARVWQRVARHEVVSMHALTGPPREPAASLVDPELRATQAEYCEVLLSHLAPLERAALELHELDELDELDDRAIAQRYGTTPGSVRSSRSKAKQKLRALVKMGELPPPTHVVYRDAIRPVNASPPAVRYRSS